MSKIEDGGPAFPNAPDMMRSAASGLEGAGMSMRDWFAGQVMEKMISLTMDHENGWCDRTVAAGCYRLADAMIAARKTGGE